MSVLGGCCRAQTEPSSGPVVALTFDDMPAAGPRPADESRVAIVQSLLTTLKSEKMPPVYGFVNGLRVEEAPETAEVLRLWRSAGNLLGSHTYTHPDLETTPVQVFEENVLRNEPILRQVSGTSDWHWFRYPFLHEGESQGKAEAVAAFLKQHGYRTAEVSLDFEDYLWEEPDVRCKAKQDQAHIAALHDSYLAIADEYIDIYRSLTRRLYGRDIPYVLLLHENAFNARMLPDLIALLRARGFAFTTMPEALADPVYTEAKPYGYATGGALQELAASARKLPVAPNAKPYQWLDRVCR